MQRLTRYDVHSLPTARIFYDEDFNCRVPFTLQSCKDLADSIEANGLNFPVVVQPITDMSDPPAGYDWRMLTGHRRYKAITTFLKWPEIPAMIREGLSDKEARMLNFTENLERKDLNILEEARWIRGYYGEGATLRAIAADLKRDTKWVHARVRLINLPEEIQNMAVAGMISNADIECIANQEPEHQLKVANDIINAKRIGKSYETAHKYGRKFAYRKTKTQIGQKVSQLMQVGLEGLVTRFGAWCAGYIDDDEFDADIAKELRDRRNRLA